MRQQLIASEIDSRILDFPLQNNNLNRKTLSQFENAGSEVILFRQKNTNIIGIRVNPIDKLAEAEKITNEEYRAARNYQKRFEDANKSGYCCPTLIYDGLPDSARSTKQSENTPTDDRIRASAFVTKAKQAIARASNPRQISGFKDFKTPGAKKFSRDLQLLDILKYVFEQEISIRMTEELLKSDHRTIEKRVKKICEILVDL